MSSIAISGDTSGAITLAAPAIAGTNTITLPAGTGTATVAGVNSNIVSGTAQATTSGTSITFTGIPSWAKRITVIFNNVSTSGTSLVQVQLGSGSVTTTGYVSSASNTSNGYSSTSGLVIFGVTSTDSRIGIMTITNISGNTWVAAGNIISAVTVSANWGCAGNITLSGTLDRLVVTTVNGTDTFDAGSINIMYE